MSDGRVAHATESAPKSEGQGFTRFLVVACLALATLVVLLSIQNRRLKNDLAEAASMAVAVPQGPQLEEGYRVAPLELFDADGADEVVSFEGDKTLVALFTTTCPHCKTALPIWEETFPQFADREGVRIIGVELDRPAPEAGSASDTVAASYAFPVYGMRRDANPDFRERVTGVPTLVLLDGDGRVERRWIGPPDEAAVGEIVSLLEEAAV